MASASPPRGHGCARSSALPTRDTAERRSTGPATASSSPSRAHGRRSPPWSRSSARSPTSRGPPTRRCACGSVSTRASRLSATRATWEWTSWSRRGSAPPPTAIRSSSHARRAIWPATSRPGRLVPPLGRHRLKDVPAATQLFQLAAPGLHDEFPPLRTLSATSLPTLHHRLVGRADALARIESLLEEPGRAARHHHGPGGAGKSRLALEVAALAPRSTGPSISSGSPPCRTRSSSPTRSRARSASASPADGRSSRPSQTR